MLEWNERLEEDYRRYVGDKWMQGLSARDRAGYREARERWQRAKEVGDRFRDGMMAIRGHTAEKGYVKEAHLANDRLGRRFHDARNDRLGRAYEYKSGRLDKEKTLPQLTKDEIYMSQGGLVDWTIVEGARIDKEVQDRLQRLREKFPRQFTVQEVSREELRQALTVAKHLEKVKTREEREKALGERAREEGARREARVRENEERKKEIARVVSANVSAIERARVEGKVFPARELSEAHRSVVRSLRKVRRHEKAQGRETVASLGLSGERARTMETILSEGRERQREQVVRGVEAIGQEAKSREVAEKEAAGMRAREAERLAKQREMDARRQEMVRQGDIDVGVAKVLDALDKGQARLGDPVPPHLQNITRLRGARERDGRERGLHRER